MPFETGMSFILTYRTVLRSIVRCKHWTVWLCEYSTVGTEHIVLGDWLNCRQSVYIRLYIDTTINTQPAYSKTQYVEQNRAKQPFQAERGIVLFFYIDTKYGTVERLYGKRDVTFNVTASQHSVALFEQNRHSVDKCWAVSSMCDKEFIV